MNIDIAQSHKTAALCLSPHQFANLYFLQKAHKSHKHKAYYPEHRGGNFLSQCWYKSVYASQYVPAKCVFVCYDLTKFPPHFANAVRFRSVRHKNNERPTPDPVSWLNGRFSCCALPFQAH